MLTQRTHFARVCLSAAALFLAALPSIAVFAEESPMEAAKTLYDSKCASCHAKSGDGSGRKGRDLTPPPTDFTDPKHFTDKKKQNMTPDERMIKATKEGGPAVGQSKGMDAFPDLTADQLRDLLAYIKTFQKK